MSLMTYKYRIYPTQEQAVQIDKTIGCTRLVYNSLLADCKKQNYVLNGGSSRFVATDKEVVIGYVITLEESNGN